MSGNDNAQAVSMSGVSQARPHHIPLWPAAAVLILLLIRFGGYISLGSIDVVHHYFLVDEVMKYGGVGNGSGDKLGLLRFYPPASHWLAAVIGWTFGSGLVGMTLITIVSVYLCYILVLYLIDASSLTNVIAFSLAFILLRFSDSLIGWEVVRNYFYPQLVADVLFLASLLWLSRYSTLWKQSVFIIASGVAAMWIHPLVAVHILASGSVLLSFRFVEQWRYKSENVRVTAVWVVLVLVLSALVIRFHPAFTVMRSLAGNNGVLEFGYGNLVVVSVFCAAAGVWNLWHRLRGSAEYVDAVIGSAVVAAACLVFMQFAMLNAQDGGSVYAVKKHMFIVVTLGIMNATRVVGRYAGPMVRVPFGPGYVAPVAAGLAAVTILSVSYTTPVEPILRALAYANRVATFELPGLVPGNTVDADATQSPLINYMVSISAFHHPFNERAVSWLSGSNPVEGARFAMVRSSPSLASDCKERIAENDTYEVVPVSCLKAYSLNAPLGFAVDGSGWRYVSGGWYPAETWGAWSVGNVDASVELSLPPDSVGPYRLVVDAQAFLPPNRPAQTIDVGVNGTKVATWTFTVTSATGVRVAEIPSALVKDRAMKITFRTVGPSASAAQLGYSADQRVLGFGVKTLTVAGPGP